MKRVINAFISSTFINTHRLRDQIIFEVRPLLDQMFIEKDIDIQLNIIDLRWGVDEREFSATKGVYAQVLEACFRSLDDADIYIGINSDYRGIIVPDNEIDLLNSQYQWGLPYNKSLTELEYWYCMNVKQNPMKYCQISFKGNDDSVNDVVENNGVIIVNGDPGYRLTELLVRNLLSIIEKIKEERKATSRNERLEMTVQRKKYIQEITNILFHDEAPEKNKEKTVKLILIKGESGIGKSVLLSQVEKQISVYDQLIVTYLPDAKSTRGLDDLIIETIDRISEEIPQEDSTLPEKIRYLGQLLNNSMTPCFIIDSIDDITPEYFNQFLVELSDNFRDCYVITSSTKPIGMRYNRCSCRTLEMEGFTKWEIEESVKIFEKALSKRLPKGIHQRLLECENTLRAKPIVFQLILNDVSWLSSVDYQKLVDNEDYSYQIERLMMERYDNYPTDIDGIIRVICNRISGNIGNEEENELIQKYLALIDLSYRGINETYMSKVLGEEWKPLLFYQLRYSFRNVFSVQRGMISFAHSIFKEAFNLIIDNELFYSMAEKVSDSDLENNELAYEKFRMMFYTENFERWYELACSGEGWIYVNDCLREYCQLVPILNKKYLTIPQKWLSYMSQLSKSHILSNVDYNNTINGMYSFINELVDTASTDRFDSMMAFCKKMENAFLLFKRNCEDEKIEKKCDEIISYSYYHVIGCADRFSVHEKAGEIFDIYELLYSSESNKNNSETNSDLEIIQKEMQRIYSIAKHKEATDADRSEIVKEYMQVLQKSMEFHIPCLNFGHVIEFLNLYGDKTYVNDYVDFAVALAGEILENNENKRINDVLFIIDAFHCKMMLEMTARDIETAILSSERLIMIGYVYAKLLYERFPHEVRCIYTYSMVCSDIVLFLRFHKDYDGVKRFNNIIKGLKGYLHYSYPDVFLYANSYCGFLINSINDETIYSEEQCLGFADEAMKTMVPYLKQKNVNAGWTYLNFWDLLIRNIDNKKNTDRNNKMLSGLQKYLEELPSVLNFIFDLDKSNIEYRKEVMNRIIRIYNAYRLLAERDYLRMMATALYECAKQICEIEDSDASYELLASIIGTLCVDQTIVPQEKNVSDLQLLKEFQGYIENKITSQPYRVALHRSMLKVPETEIIEMVVILNRIESMPVKAKFLCELAFNRLDLDPMNTIMESAKKMIDRMRTIKSLNGDIPQESIDIAKMALLLVSNSKTRNSKEAKVLSDELTQFVL